MSREYQNADPLTLAKQAEHDLNSQAAKQGHNLDHRSKGSHGASDSSAYSILPHKARADMDPALESGVDESVRNKFPGADVLYGSGASGAGDNREIPLSEGGDLDPRTGQ